MRRFVSSDQVIRSAEELEPICVMTVGVSSLAPLYGTLNATGDWECTDPTVTGVVQNVAPEHTARIEVDHDGDGTAENVWEQAGSETTFVYDPRSAWNIAPGPVNLQFRVTELDTDGAPLATSEWTSLQYEVVAEPSPPPEEYVAPTIVDFSFAGRAGDWYTFSGTVTGSHVAGGTVTFDGLLSGLSTIIAEDGTFSVSSYSPGGMHGLAYAQATDTQGGMSDQVAVYVDEDPGEEPTNNAPTSPDLSYSVDQDGVLDVSAAGGLLSAASDTEGNSLSVVPYESVTAAGGYVVIRADGSFTYTPAAGFSGTDYLDFQISDGTTTSNNVVAHITINAVNNSGGGGSGSNTAPTSPDLSYSVDQDGVLDVSAAGGLLSAASDAEGNSLSVVPYESVTAAGGYVVIRADGSFTYTPAAGFSGTDYLDFQISDGTDLSNNVVAHITINSV